MQTPAARFVRARLMLCALVLAALPSLAPAQQVGVRINIRLNAESVEVLRAWRRANHLDPPDAAADARLRERLAAAKAGDAGAAARERRRLRTVELVPVEGTDAGLKSGACAALPTETDPCTRVVQYRPAGAAVELTDR